ncbi:5'/3'-nucleotidase SurE [Facklamia miroungae]|uniref:5'-nucleotidase SurE n=1 Tax=Facklamia miroungae TaxID=120956 RepID=A0A1G7V420_9LACT|nr:5'/3'-nucleotidase SurE [Facklamia miroungae]NKZ30223.1 5'/3'-nucleotidase SurE [Facklamia miroungae]SDG54506.1 5'-nucleotidase [Facklamia miroungae]
MRILISNDDGVYAPGVLMLISLLEEIADLTVVCPESQRSGYSHGISVANPVGLTPVFLKKGISSYSVDGTPVDCIKLALETLYSEKPDWVISGINAGANVGQDIFYSGTVAAAREATLYGIPAIAMSLARDGQNKLDYTNVNLVLKDLLPKLLSLKVNDFYFLNLNIPTLGILKPDPIRVVNPEIINKKFDFFRLKNPKGQEVYWLSNRYHRMDTYQGESDYQLLKEGYITLSPISVQPQVNQSLLNEIQNRLNN